ncbi:MAG TPA: hypothetical protein PLW10_25240, partial [Myxococcota bacterium]|nr:hypothetical protein [Myxococcota bacterium]
MVDLRTDAPSYTPSFGLGQGLLVSNTDDVVVISSVTGGRGTARVATGTRLIAEADAFTTRAWRYLLPHESSDGARRQLWRRDCGDGGFERVEVDVFGAVAAVEDGLYFARWRFLRDWEGHADSALCFLPDDGSAACRPFVSEEQMVLAANRAGALIAGGSDSIALWQPGGGAPVTLLEGARARRAIPVGGAFLAV